MDGDCCIAIINTPNFDFGALLALFLGEILRDTDKRLAHTNAQSSHNNRT